MSGFTGKPSSQRKSEVHESPFNINNLPYGIISSKNNPKKRCATVLGAFAIDLSVLYARGLFNECSGLLPHSVFDREYLNEFASLPISIRRNVREKVIQYLTGMATSSTTSIEDAHIPLSEVENHYPMDTRNFSDFYCSLEHTQNYTALSREDGQISSNWFTAPLVYNGRTSSLVVSGTPVKRPCGITIASGKDTAAFQPEGRMDFELEMGVFLAGTVPRGERLDINQAKEKIFGFVLLNDWSARDIQKFEMTPLGPFHGKGAGTSISPWIVPIEALEASLCPISTPQNPPPLPHLAYSDEDHATFDIEVSVKIIRDGVSYTLGQSNLNELHWTPFQQLAHLASAGEGLSTGDVFGTGTISSSRTNESGEKTGLGCIVERQLPYNNCSSCPDKIAETFLMDGDRVVLEGWCRDASTKAILFGFGKCEGVILPALPR